MGEDGETGVRPAIAFVGVLASADPAAHGAAFNRAGQMFQEGLLNGLSAAGMPANILLSLEPIPAFPGGGRIFGRSGRFVSGSGRAVRLLPFINIHPLKWFTAGLSVVGAVAWWSWRHRGRPRLVHCVNISMPPGLFVWLTAKLTGTRTLVSVLDVFIPGELVPDTLFRRLDFALHRWLLPRYDGLMVIAKAIADDFVPGRRVCFLDGGIAPEPFAAAPRERRSRTAGAPFRIVLSGSLERYNGVELALDAMTRLPEGFELIFAGNGSLTPLVREAVKRDPRISYRGFLDFKDVLDLYWSADLLLNLRLTRAVDTRYFFPSKLMELLASGTPVLSTCTGHVEKEYGHVLELLGEETPEALAKRIVEIAALPDADRQALGARARDFMFAEKTWQKQGGRLAHYIRTEVLK
jgi:glycosyltransferase involved in cell wall biosynthesis